MFQMRKTDKTPERNLKETETSNLPDKKFKVKVIKMLTKLRRKINEHSKYKEIKYIRKF